MHRLIALLLSFLFTCESAFGQLALDGLVMSGGQSAVSEKFRPLHLRYLSSRPHADGFRFLLDKGDSRETDPEEVARLSNKLMEYFKIGLTLPDDIFWVNLRPDSPDQMIEDSLARTDIGRIFLETDLQLKKDTAGYTSPKTKEGSRYWDKLYKKAEELYGDSSIRIPTLVRPWIVPGEIIVGESETGVYIYKATLKVMLEQDYLKDAGRNEVKDERGKQLNEYSAQLMREQIIPRIAKEVNSSKKYAAFRQVYYSLILAHCFKSSLKNSLPVSYAGAIDKKDLAGLTSAIPWDKDTYYRSYQESFSKGEYNLNEQAITTSGTKVKSYFSGGVSTGLIASVVRRVQESRPIEAIRARYLLRGEAGDRVTMIGTRQEEITPETRLLSEVRDTAQKDGGKISDAIRTYVNTKIENVVYRREIAQRSNLAIEEIDGRFPEVIERHGYKGFWQLAEAVQGRVSREELFTKGIFNLPNVFTKEELVEYWPDIVALGVSVPHEAENLFKYGLPAARALITDRESLKTIGNDLIRFYMTFSGSDKQFTTPFSALHLYKDILTERDMLLSFITVSEQLGKRRIELFAAILYRVMGSIGKERFKEYWPKLAELILKLKDAQETLGDNYFSMFLTKGVPFAAGLAADTAMFCSLADDLLALGESSKENQRLFSEGMPALLQEFGRQRLQEYWPDLVALGKTAGPGAAILFLHLPAAAPLTRDRGSLVRIGTDLITLGQKSGWGSVGALKKTIEKLPVEELRKYWPVLMELAAATGEKSKYLFEYGVPMFTGLVDSDDSLRAIWTGLAQMEGVSEFKALTIARRLMTDTASITTIAAELAIIGRAAGKKASIVFERGFPVAEHLITDQASLKAVGDVLIELAGLLEKDWDREEMFKTIASCGTLIPDSESLRAVGTDIVEMNNAFNKRHDTMFIALRYTLETLGMDYAREHWGGIKERVILFCRKTNPHNRERLAFVFLRLCSALAKEKGFDYLTLADFVLEIIDKQGRLALQISEGVAKAMSVGVITPQSLARQRELIYAFAEMTHSFNPWLFSIFEKEGSAGLQEVLDFAEAVGSDAVGETELVELAQTLSDKGVPSEEIDAAVTTAIRYAIPSSGASFVRQDEIAGLYMNYRKTGDKRADIPESLTGKDFGGGKPIDLVEYGLKPGEEFDPEGRIRGIVERLRYKDRSLSNQDKKMEQEKDLAAFKQSLTEWFMVFQDHANRQAALDSFYAYVSHNELLGEKIDAISGDYEALNILETLFTDKDSLSTLAREVLAMIDPTLLPKRGRTIDDTRKVVRQIVGIWEKSKDGREQRLKAYLSQYNRQDIQEKIIPSVKTEELKTAIGELSGGQAAINQAEIISRLFSQPHEWVEAEKAKFVPQKKGTVELVFRVVKGIPYGLWGLNAGVCIATDLELWKKKEFMLLAMIDKNTETAGGFCHLFVTEVSGKPVLTVPGIEPSVELLGEVKAAEVFPQIEEALIEVAKAGGFEAVYIPADQNIMSNRTDIAKLVMKQYAARKVRLFQEVQWNTLPQPYPFSEVYEMWRQDEAQKDGGRLSDAEEARMRAYLASDRFIDMDMLDRDYAEIIKIYGYSDFKELYEASGKSYWFKEGFKKLREMFTPEELKTYWPTLVELGLTAKKGAMELFRYWLPSVNYLITDAESLKAIGNETISIADAAGENSWYLFMYGFEAAKKLIFDQASLRSMGSALVELKNEGAGAPLFQYGLVPMAELITDLDSLRSLGRDLLVFQKNAKSTEKVFKYGVARFKNTFMWHQDVKAFWPDIVELGAAAGEEVGSLFYEVLPFVSSQVFSNPQSFAEKWPDLVALYKACPGDAGNRMLVYGLPKLKKIFTEEEFNRYWPALAVMGTAAGKNAYDLFDRGIPELLEMFGAEGLQKHWQEITAMGTAAGQNSVRLFWIALPNIEELLGGRFEEYWPTLAALAVSAGEESYELFNVGFPKLREMFPEDEFDELWPFFTESGLAAGTAAGALFAYGLPACQSIITRESLREITGILVELGKAGGSNAIGYGLPAARDLVTDTASLRAVAGDLAELGAMAPEIKDGVFRGLWVARELVLERGSLLSIGRDLSSMGIAAGGKHEALFYRLLPALTEYTSSAEGLRACWPSMIALVKGTGGDVEEFFTRIWSVKDVLGKEYVVGNWQQLVKSTIAISRKINTHNRERLLPLIFKETPAVAREKGFDYSAMLEFFVSIINREERLAFQVWEGILEAMRLNMITPETFDAEKPSIISFVGKTRSFSPWLYTMHRQLGEAGLQQVLDFSAEIRTDDVGKEEISRLEGMLRAKGVPRESIPETVTACIQMVIPSSGASFVKKHEITGLYESHKAGRDYRNDVAEPLRGKDFGPGSRINLVGYALLPGQIYDPDGAIGSIIERLRYKDGALSESDKKQRQDKDREVFARVLSDWFKNFTDQAKRDAAREAFYDYAGHNDLLGEKIDAISGDNYEALSLLEALFSDKDNLSILAREVLDTLDPSLFPKTGAKIEDARKVVRNLERIWNNPKANTQIALKSILSRFNEADIREQLVPLIEDEALKEAVQNLGGTKQISQSEIIEHLFNEPYSRIVVEKDKFTGQTAGQVELEFRVVKGIPYGLWGLNAGVCIATDLRLWEKKEFMLLAMIDKNTGRAGGFCHLFAAEIDGRKVLTVPGIEPSVEFLTEVKAHEVYPQIEEALIRVAQAGGYEALYIPTNPNILSNRPDIVRLAQKKHGNSKVSLAKVINWNTSPQPYPFSEVYEVWRADGAQKDGGELPPQEEAAARAFLSSWAGDAIDDYWPGLVEVGIQAGTGALQFFQRVLPGLKDVFTAEELKEYWPGLMKLALAAGKSRNFLFLNFVDVRRNLGGQYFHDNWPALQDKFVSLCNKSTEYNQIWLIALLLAEYPPVIKERGFDYAAVFDFVLEILEKENRLALQISEGLLEAIKIGIVTRQDFAGQQGLILAFINDFHTFNPWLYKFYRESGDAGVREVVAFAGSILNDTVGEEELTGLEQVLRQKGVAEDSLRATVAGCIQVAIPSSGTSSVRRNKITELYWDYRQAGDRRSDVPESLRRHDFGSGKHIELVEYAIKPGEEFDPAGMLLGIIDLLRYKDRLLSDQDKKAGQDKDRESFEQSLTEWCKDFSNDAKRDAALESFYAYAGHNDLLGEQIDAISGDYEAVNILETLFADKDNLSILVREVLDMMDRTLLPKTGARIENTAKVISEVVRIWKKSQESRESNLRSFLSRFTNQDVREQIVPGIRDEEIREVIVSMGDGKNVSQSEIIERLFNRPFAAIAAEKAKFIPQTKGAVALEFRVVKGIPYGLWGHNAGVCIAEDIDLWNKKEFMLLAMIDKNTGTLAGFCHLFTAEINGGKVLTVPGIEPRVEFLVAVKAADVFPQIEEALVKAAQAGGFEAVYIPTDSLIMSNRGDISRIISKKYSSDKIMLPHPIQWNTRPQSYPFQEVYEIWRKDPAAQKGQSARDGGKTGGIDLRSLPIIRKSAASLVEGLSAEASARLSTVELSKEWAKISKLVDSGIRVSISRIREYCQGCVLQGTLEKKRDTIVLCISDLLRREEDECIPTDPAAQPMLLALQSIN